MPAAKARNAARAVATAHHALTRSRRMGALMPLDGVPGGLWIIRAIAAGIEVHLGLGSAHGAEGQRKADE